MMDDLLNTAANAVDGVVDSANAAVDHVQEMVTEHTGIDTSAVDGMQEKVEGMVDGMTGSADEAGEVVAE